MDGKKGQEWGRGVGRGRDYKGLQSWSRQRPRLHGRDRDVDHGGCKVGQRIAGLGQGQ